jgi:hypothetical protein
VVSGLQGENSEQTMKDELKKLVLEYSACAHSMDVSRLQTIHDQILKLQSKLTAINPDWQKSALSSVRPKGQKVSAAQLLVETLETHSAFLVSEASGFDTASVAGGGSADLGQEITEDPDQVQVSSVIISISNARENVES